MAVASAGLYTYHLYFTPDTQLALQHLFLYRPDILPTPKLQHQNINLQRSGLRKFGVIIKCNYHNAAFSHQYSSQSLMPIFLLSLLLLSPMVTLFTTKMTSNNTRNLINSGTCNDWKIYQCLRLSRRYLI